MDHTALDFSTIQGIFLSVLSTQEEIEKLESENKMRIGQLLTHIQKATIDWEPIHNEKAVLVIPESQAACYVWHILDAHGSRFKEAPAEVLNVNHYYRIDKYNPPEAGFYIVPLSFFKTLKEYVAFNIRPSPYGGPC